MRGVCALLLLCAFAGAAVVPAAEVVPRAEQSQGVLQPDAGRGHILRKVQRRLASHRFAQAEANTEAAAAVGDVIVPPDDFNDFATNWIWGKRGPSSPPAAPSPLPLTPFHICTRALCPVPCALCPVLQAALSMSCVVSTASSTRKCVMR
jgi:hypothetical protein